MIALFAGRFMQAGDIYRSLLQFDLSSVPQVGTVNSALLNLNMYRNEVGPSGAYIRVHRLLNSWQQDTVSWNDSPNTNPPGFSPAWDGSVYISSSSPLGLVSIDISDLVRGWVSGTIPNNGLQLAGNELENSLVGFWSPNYSFSYAWPSLVVNFVQGVLDIYDPEDLVIPSPPAETSIASTPIDLGCRQTGTFMVENNSPSTSVRVMLQVGCGSGFYAAGPWLFLDAVGNPGASVALSTSSAAEQARVYFEGAGGESLTVTPRSRQ